MFSAENAAKFVASYDDEGCHALVMRVIRSSTFAKSERLSTFLSYVCDLSMKGRADEINEQRIGTAVFGRSPDYDSSVDGIVRTQASRLRQRLNLYFDGEGSGEPVRIVIPRGSYVPQFQPRLSGESPLRATGSEAVGADGQSQIRAEGDGGINQGREVILEKIPVARNRHWYSNPVIPWTVVAVLTMVGMLIGIRELREAQNSDAGATAHPFWSTVFGVHQHTLIVSGDSGLVMWQGLMGRNVNLMEYLDGGYRKESTKIANPQEGIARDLATRRYTSIVDLDIAQSLVRIALSRRSEAEIRYARDVRPNDLKQGNVILVGTAEATPWVELFEAKMNFVFYDDRQKRIFSVINRMPKSGEPKQWDSKYDDPNHHVYAVVAYLPNLQGMGNALILEGTSMAGTESAWDFVGDDAQLVPFLHQIQRPDGSFPHFEVVLGTNNMSGSAGRNAVLAWRVM